MLVVEVKRYAYIVPFVQSGGEIFLENHLSKPRYDQTIIWEEKNDKTKK